MSIVTAFGGDTVTGIETAKSQIVSRGVLLDAGRVFGDSNGELPDAFAIKPNHLDTIIEKQGSTSKVGKGDLVLVRTGQMGRCKRQGWGTYAGM